MRFSIDFMRAFFVLLGHFFPIWGGIVILISLIGLIIAQLEDGLSVGSALYFAWVTGTTVGYGDLVPTLGITRVLAIFVAILGIVLTGIIVTMAIEAAKIVVESNTSIQEFKQSVKESAKQRAARNKRRPSKQSEEER
jgi:mannose/fructose/N-acetylgalactosamine-specific phosphotransferase system component IIC